jgi:hypothetical protein
MADEVVAVTTETSRGRSNLRTLVVSSWLLAGFFAASALSLWLAPDGCRQSPPTISDRILVTVVSIASLLVAVVWPQFITRGTWRLNTDGITFTPLRGAVQSLRWDQVEAVLDQSFRTDFRAGRQRLLLVRQWESPQRRKAVVEFLRDRLGANFDAFDRQPAKTSVRRVLWLSAIASAATLLWFAAMILACRYLPYEQLQWWAMAWGLLLPLVFFPWVLVVAWRQRRTMWSYRKLETSTPRES